MVWRDFIIADGGIVASHINNIGVHSMQYFVNNAMGSTAALTDTSGNTLERDYYDPWGKRRNANGSADTSCALASATTRGFSGHEMMDSVCMTNMNGRIYDQYLSRFASADTMVSDPGNGQDYNRYSYVDNSPTAFVDPTGHGTTETVYVTGSRLPVGNDVNPQSSISFGDNGEVSYKGDAAGDFYGQNTGSGEPGGTETVLIQGQRIPTGFKPFKLSPFGGLTDNPAVASAISGAAAGAGDAGTETVIVTAIRISSKLLPIAVDLTPPLIVLCGIFCSTSAGESCADTTALGCPGARSQE